MQRWVIGVDLGGTQIRALRTDLAGEKAARAEQLTLAQQGPQAVVSRILETVREVMAGIPGEEILGLGIGAPGPIDSAGVVHDPPNLPGWRGVSLVDELAGPLGLPIYAGNDANLGALAEYRFGAGIGVDHLVYLTVGTGIGGGVISHGRMLTGWRGFAAEIGHQTLDPDGPLCGCGQPGHLEAFASGPAIAREARKALEQGRSSTIPEHAGGAVTAKSVAAAANGGDALAIELLRQAGYYLGLGLANLIHILEPQRILIGGGVSRAGELLLGPARQTVEQRLMSPVYRGVEILSAALGPDVGLMGAAALVMQEAVSQR
ncbi:MAG TPA: ROK family protein [Anaerolineales bacterium]